MALNFAPYQSSPPESERAKSPPLRSPTSSPRPQNPRANLSSVSTADDPWAAARAQPLPTSTPYSDDPTSTTPFHPDQAGYTDLESGSGAPRFNDYIPSNRQQEPFSPETGRAPFRTSLRLPLRVEACLTYILLPPVLSSVILCFERKSEYARFHAWQSLMVFGVSVLLHIIFSWTKIVSAILSVGEFVLMVYLAVGAWRNAETLYRVELPVLGRLASGFVDDDG